MTAIFRLAQVKPRVARPGLERRLERQFGACGYASAAPGLLTGRRMRVGRGGSTLTSEETARPW